MRRFATVIVFLFALYVALARSLVSGVLCVSLPDYRVACNGVLQFLVAVSFVVYYLSR